MNRPNKTFFGIFISHFSSCDGMKTPFAQDAVAQGAVPAILYEHSPASIPITTIKPWTLPRQKTYVFVNINVVDAALGKIHANHTVRIAQGKIASITGPPSSAQSATATGQPTSSPLAGDDALHIDCAGKFLCPGLIDAHVHLASVPGEPDLRSSSTIPATVSLLRQPFQAKAMLERGFTTARDCGGATVALKEAIAEGLIPGPRLFIAGHGLSQTGGHGDPRGPYDASGGDACCGHSGGRGLSQVVDGVPAVLAVARDQLRQGADFLKLIVGGGVASPADKLTSIQFTPNEIRAATDVASASGTFATAHAYAPEAIRRAVENGVKGIEHGNFLDKGTARFLADQGVYLTPTLVTYQAMADPKYAAFLPAANRVRVSLAGAGAGYGFGLSSHP